jgi:hypothetical protein
LTGPRSRRQYCTGWGMYQVIDREVTATRYAEAPTVLIEAASGQPTTVTLRYASSYVDRGGKGRTTEVTFRHVLDFRFRDQELGLDGTDAGNSAFALIEISDSELIGQFIAAGRVRMRSDGVVREGDLRHFRLTFDEHGRYDVVCTERHIDTS